MKANIVGIGKFDGSNAVVMMDGTVHDSGESNIESNERWQDCFNMRSKQWHERGKRFGVLRRRSSPNGAFPDVFIFRAYLFHFVAAAPTVTLMEGACDASHSAKEQRAGLWTTRMYKTTSINRHANASAATRRITRTLVIRLVRKAKCEV